MIVLQDILNQPQNWTLVGILGAVLIAVIGLLVWIVKWLCTRFTSSVDNCSVVVDKNTTVVGESTQTNLRVVEHLTRLQESHDDIRRSIDTLPSRTVEELQRRRLP